GVAGNQVRGFGFLHDGSVPTVFNFLQAQVFNFGANANTKRQQVEQFVLSFDTGLAPIVGQQVTATDVTFTDATVTGRINLAIARAQAGECDLVVRGILANQARGWLYRPASGTFQSDRASEPLISESTLRTQAGTGGQERTYTCVPPGSGTRIALDRDEDGFFDRTELDAGSDPANAASTPGATTTTSTSSSTTTSTSHTTSTSSSTTTSTSHTTSTTASTTTSSSTSSSSTTSTSTTIQGTTSSTSSSSTTSTSHTTSTSTSTSSSTSTTLQGATTTTSTSATSITSTSATTSTSTSTTLPGGAFVLVPTTPLTLRDDSGSTPNPSARKIAFKSSTRGATTTRITPPARLGPDDPTLHGATLVVYDSAGTGQKVTIVLPTGGWIPLGSADHPKGFKFKNPDPAGASSAAIVSPDTIKVRGGKANWPYPRASPPQGRIAVQLTLGTGTPWCTDAPARTSGNPPSTATSDTVGKFTAAKK